MSKIENKQFEVPPNTTNESEQRLEAIKNLIFGENIEQINTDFDTIKKLIEKRKEELESFIEETSKNLNTLIDNLSTDVNIRITDLEENLNEKIDTLNQNKVDRNTLGKLLTALGEKIMKD
jgi:archaellum component FlaC